MDSYTLETLKERGIDVEEFLKAHNAYEALKEANALLLTGATRTNVNSIIIAVIL